MYIQSANQISVQKPLSDEWFDNPVFYEDKRVPTIDPDYKEHFPPLVARRMCVLLKRAVLMSRLTLKEASVEMPDAIISGTGLGCIDNTEKFIYSIMDNEEKFLQPTFFMQSTHNIISSTIAIDLKCHGYNNTFVHRWASFENALLDALMQFGQGRIQTALVGGYDELTNDYYKFFDRLGLWNFAEGMSPVKRCFAGEASINMLLGATKNEQTICEISDVELLYNPTHEQISKTLDTMFERAGCTLSDIDAVMTGLSTLAENDKVYYDVIGKHFGDRPIMQYKHLFGESFSASAIGTYAAMTCLRRGRIPSFMLVDKGSINESFAVTGNNATPDWSPKATVSTGGQSDINGVKRILVYNHHSNKPHSFILLSSCLN